VRADLEERVRIDTRGLWCPVPILRARDRLKKVAAGTLLEVLSDDPVILRDMPAFCRAHGHEYIGHADGPREGDLLLTLRKSGGER
jgi:tRNA 2-thiouridine synthesizing protein A